MLTLIKSKKSNKSIIKLDDDAYSVSNMSHVSAKSMISIHAESDPESESVITSSTNMTSL